MEHVIFVKREYRKPGGGGGLDMQYKAKMKMFCHPANTKHLHNI